MQSTFRAQIHQMIRVNYAGERGAIRIYEGQYAALKNTPYEPVIAHMLAQEKAHADKFQVLLLEKNVRPTRLEPLWDIAGYALGFLSAKIGGHKAAMACTVAVEDVIDQHYLQQMSRLQNLPSEKPLLDLVTACREDELEHQATALHHDAAHMPGYRIFSKAVRAASLTAIWLSKRV